MLRCPRCQTENEDDARLCRECGAGLTGHGAVGAAPPTGVPSSAGAACPSCGRPAPADAQFCDNCGSRLTTPVERPTSTTTTCRSCGRPAPADAEFCPRCGKTLGGVEYASFWRRVGGYLLDGLIVGVPVGILVGIVSAIIISSAPDVAFTQEQLQERQDAETMASIVSMAISFVVGLAYIVLLNANGGTFGKKILGMRLEHAETGENIGIGRALARYVVAIASFLAILLGYLWCIWDDKKQTWHDKAANSIVVRR